jgi:class 3 adenylate cyclase
LRGERVERRLAAILAADVAGYSRLMGQDEAGTLARHRTHRRELIDPKITEHKGRIVKTTGDGLLVEFPSVVEGVTCAVAVQREMAERNASVPEEQKIKFRVGINLGDVIVKEGDIHGDGVNVAARLEALTERDLRIDHGSRPYRRPSRCEFHDIGERALKNVARPLRVYRVWLATYESAPPGCERDDRPLKVASFRRSRQSGSARSSDKTWERPTAPDTTHGAEVLRGHSECSATRFRWLRRVFNAPGRWTFCNSTIARPN